MSNESSLDQHRREVESDLATMRAAVAKAQQASLQRGNPISYLKDGQAYFVIPSDLAAGLAQLKPLASGPGDSAMSD